MVISINNRKVLIQTSQARSSRMESASALESIIDLLPADSSEPRNWLVTENIRGVDKTLHPWDAAHGVLLAPDAAGLEATAPIHYVEPDFVQSFPYKLPEPKSLESALEAAEACQQRLNDPDWATVDAQFGWHLGDNFSQLKAARDALGDPGDSQRILIGILDTGYDPGHASLPLHMHYEFARNFTGDGSNTNATDPGSSFPLNNPGHGTATLALLAGKIINRTTIPLFNDFIGGAPYAQVVPIRIADSVIHFHTSAMAQGIEYAANSGCQVISISMGGVPTQLWADAVNKAYEKGMCIFAAAGNRIGPFPPETLVYPARFARVVAVCGFTADKTPYFKEGLHQQMHGCFGPTAAMRSAMAAYTPNIPWASMGCGSLMNLNGAGTSSATPQCAAAATLWLQKYRPDPDEKWRVVEAVRHALFSTADKTPTARAEFFGNGLLRAHDALTVDYRDDLPMTPADGVSFPWLRLLGALEATGNSITPQQKMFETEALQLFLQSPSLQKIADGADPHADELDRTTLKKFVDKLRQSPSASKTLRTHLNEVKARL
jgi:hypothetical protein